MRFSIYSEIQYWGDKTPKRAYDEVIEQVVHADGSATTPTESSSTSSSRSSRSRPTHSRCGASAAAKTRNIKFRTLGHVLPYHNPTILASQIAAAGILFEGRYEFGALRGHGWIPAKAGVPIRESRDRYEESLEILFQALRDERFSYDGTYYTIDDAQIWPRPEHKFRVFLGGTSDRTYELGSRERLGRRRAAAPPLRGAPAPARPLPRQVRRARHRARTSSGSTPVYIDEDRDIARARGRARHAAVPGRQRLAADSTRTSTCRRPRTWKPRATASTSPGSWRSSRRPH